MGGKKNVTIPMTLRLAV